METLIFISWSGHDCQVGDVHGVTKQKTNATQDEKKQFMKLMQLCEQHCMLQVIEEPTREENILDLLFTNKVGNIAEVEVNKSAISDHNRIEVDTRYKIKEEKLQQNNQTMDGTLRSLNFHAEEKIDWELVTKQVEELPWKDICERGDATEIK